MTVDIVPLLRKLGFNKYEAKVYSSLIGLRRATAREIHEVSEVPRGRIYEILHDLSRRGFIGVEEGSPNSYYVLDTDVVIDRMKEDYIASLEKVRETLKSIEFKVPDQLMPPWFALRSEWAIENHINSIFRKVQDELIMLCDDPEFLKKYEKNFKQLKRKISVHIVVPEIEPYLGINLPIYKAQDTLREILRETKEHDMEISKMTAGFLIDQKEIFVIAKSGIEHVAFIGSNTPIIRYLAKSIIERIEE